MRISDWSSDVCSSDLAAGILRKNHATVPVSRPISRSVIGRRTRASASLLEPVFWIKIYLRHAKAAFDLLGLHDHINQQLEQAANVVDRKSTRLNSSH